MECESGLAQNKDYTVARRSSERIFAVQLAGSRAGRTFLEADKDRLGLKFYKELFRNGGFYGVH